MAIGMKNSRPMARAATDRISSIKLMTNGIGLLPASGQHYDLVRPAYNRLAVLGISRYASSVSCGAGCGTECAGKCSGRGPDRQVSRQSCARGKAVTRLDRNATGPALLPTLVPPLAWPRQRPAVRC